MAQRVAAGGPPGLGEVLDFLRVLWAIEHQLKSASKQMQRRLGVTGPQRLVMRIVERYPDMSAGELAGIVHLHPSTVTGIVERLVQRRLVSRVRDAADQRRVRLRIAAAGRRVDRGAAIEAAVGRVLSAAKPAEVRAARRLLQSLVESLEAQTTGEKTRRLR